MSVGCDQSHKKAGSRSREEEFSGAKLNLSQGTRVMQDFYSTDVDSFVGELIRNGLKRVVRVLMKPVVAGIRR